ncbi:MAG: toll/interleukin-1 receptor domain-containing protein, partial [Lachnospiraceae bacterium]|nr:toll/interleukin-1 receptor domain-containing protein [Lachnospiraceae bacterium]
PAYQAKQLPEYDLFISHASKDKEELVEKLYQSLSKLGIHIFYDKESLEWGDNWKEKILNGTKRAEFAIIVISENFFDREWTERELVEFLNRQNRNGQKLILPILHNISLEQLQEKYPSVANIQAIDSKKYTCDHIALLFAGQLIKRLKNL